MINVMFSDEDARAEKDRIVEFLKKSLNGKKAVVGVSGGLDSDVVARLLALAINVRNLKLFIVLQNDMEETHLQYARELALDLKICLHEIDLSDLPSEFVRRLAVADPQQNFRPNGLLDPSRAKCSLRTPVLSTYQDRGFDVIGTSNRTEYELGFFLPFGDGIAHMKPIAHLYKTQVRNIALQLGTRAPVLNQPASAGFWKGETDLEDLAYWLFNEAPIQQERSFSDDDEQEVAAIKSELTTESVDLVLFGITGLRMKDEEINIHTGLSLKTIQRFRQLVRASEIFKCKPYNIRLEPRSTWGGRG
jgi:NAD+ synthase